MSGVEKKMPKYVRRSSMIVPKISGGIQHNMAWEAAKFSAHQGISAHVTGNTSPKDKKWPNQPKKVHKIRKVGKKVNKIRKAGKKTPTKLYK